jgi:hypothetical protein
VHYPAWHRHICARPAGIQHHSSALAQTGTLPEQWSRWFKMGGLDVAYNQLSGTLPAAYSQLRPSVDPQLTTLTHWDFSNNR